MSMGYQCRSYRKLQSLQLTSNQKCKFNQHWNNSLYQWQMAELRTVSPISSWQGHEMIKMYPWWYYELVQTFLKMRPYLVKLNIYALWFKHSTPRFVKDSWQRISIVNVSEEVQVGTNLGIHILGNNVIDSNYEAPCSNQKKLTPADLHLTSNKSMLKRRKKTKKPWASQKLTLLTLLTTL